MRIDKAEVIVTSPDRNFVTLRLTTDDASWGWGMPRSTAGSWLFNTVWDYQTLIKDQLIDYVRLLSPMPAGSPR